MFNFQQKRINKQKIQNNKCSDNHIYQFNLANNTRSFFFIFFLYFFFSSYSLCLPFKHAGTGEFGVVIVQITQQVGSLSKGAKTKPSMINYTILTSGYSYGFQFDFIRDIFEHKML